MHGVAWYRFRSILGEHCKCVSAGRPGRGEKPFFPPCGGGVFGFVGRIAGSAGAGGSLTEGN